MIFNKDIVFIHVPKAAGNSITQYLRSTLARPIYDTGVPIHPKVDYQGIVRLPEHSHYTLEAARALLAKQGFDIAKHPLIVAVMRNPYAMDVSRYHYLRKNKEYDRGSDQTLALSSDFETFAVKSGNHHDSIEKYFLLDGKIPPNLQIVRFSHLQQDLGMAFKRVGMDAYVQLPHANRSKHGNPFFYYTKKAEEGVYKRYQWLFDMGFYKRMDTRLLSDKPIAFWSFKGMRYWLRDLEK